ncbi:hypothetical protein ACFVWP_31160 [Streptomyces sp. NPDC058175]
MNWDDHIAQLLLTVFGLLTLFLMLLRSFGRDVIAFIREVREEWNKLR